MKQHITVKQLNELSEKGKKQFRVKFWKIYEGDLLIYGLYNQNKFRGEPIVFKYGMIPADEESFGYKLLSIGQMIEFLSENGVVNIDEDLRQKEWGFAFKIPAELGYKKDFQIRNELCDALWEAVKKILEKKL